MGALLPDIQASPPTCHANSPSPIPRKPSKIPVSSALKAEAWTVPTSPTSNLAPISPVTVITASSFDVRQTSAVCPRLLHWLHSFSVQGALIWPCFPHLQHLLTGAPPSAALAQLPLPPAAVAESHHYWPRSCLYRLVRVFPDVRRFRCRGFHLPRCRHRHHHRRTGRAQSSIPFCLPPGRWCRSRKALMISSRPVLPRDTRTRASTSYSAGRASMMMVYSMYVVVKGKTCCTHICGNILDPTHLLKRVAPWRYLETIKSSKEVRFGPSCLRTVSAFLAPGLRAPPDV